MTGQKAALPKNIIEWIIQQRKDIKESLGYISKGTVALGVSASSNSFGEGGGSVPSSGTTPITFDNAFNGPISFIPKIGFINNGRLDISFENADALTAENAFSSYVLVTGTGSPDDVKFIDGSIAAGQTLRYQGTNQQIQNVISGNLITGSFVGDGATTTITATIPDTSVLVNGQSVNVVGAADFEFGKDDVIIAITGGTTFTYEIDAIGSTSAAAGIVEDGNIFADDGKDIVLDGTKDAFGVPFVDLIFDITIASGAWRVVSVSPGVVESGNVPDGNNEFDHLQWDGAAWIAQRDLEFGTNSASSGSIRNPNDIIGIAWRNAANDGDLELKVDSANFFDFASSLDGVVALKIRATDAVDPDNTFVIAQFGGSTGATQISGPNSVGFISGSTDVFNYDANKIETEVNILPVGGDGTLRIGNVTAPNRFLGVHATEFSLDVDRKLNFSTGGASLTVDGTNDTFTITVETFQRAQFSSSLTELSGNVNVLGDLTVSGDGIIDGTNASQPNLILNRVDATADDQEVGIIRFQGLDDVAVAHAWAEIRGLIVDNNDTDAEGGLQIYVSTDTLDDLELFMEFNGDSAVDPITLFKEVTLVGGINGDFTINGAGINTISSDGDIEIESEDIILNGGAAGFVGLRINDTNVITVVADEVNIFQNLDMNEKVINELAAIDFLEGHNVTALFELLQITLASSSIMTILNDTTLHYTFDEGKFTIQSTDESPATAQLILFDAQTDPDEINPLAVLAFAGNNSLNVQEFYSTIIVSAVDTDDTEESAQVDWSMLSGGSNNVILRGVGHATDPFSLEIGPLNDTDLLGFYGIQGIAQFNSTDNSPTAGGTYGATEQKMLQNLWDAMVGYNLLDETP